MTEKPITPTFSNLCFSFNQSDGQSRYEKGDVINKSTDREIIRVIGFFSFVGPDGNVYTVRYTADENGFHPQGKHIPLASDVITESATDGALFGGDNSVGDALVNRILSQAVGSLAGGGLG